MIKMGRVAILSTQNAARRERMKKVLYPRGCCQSLPSFKGQNDVFRGFSFGHVDECVTILDPFIYVLFRYVGKLAHAHTGMS